MLRAALSLGAHTAVGAACYVLLRRLILRRPRARCAAAVATVLAHGLAFGCVVAPPLSWEWSKAKSTASFALGMCLMSRLTVVGVTGGIACGKSVFGHHLRQRYGAVVIDCDIISREVRCLGPDARGDWAVGRRREDRARILASSLARGAQGPIVGSLPRAEAFAL